jgi:hypothetical protein
MPRLLLSALLLAAALGGCKRDARPPPTPTETRPGASGPKAAHEVATLSYLPTVPALTADGDKIGVTLHAKEAYEGLFLNCSTKKPPGLTVHTASGDVVHEIKFPHVKWYYGCHDVVPHPSGDLLIIGDWAVLRIGWGGEVRWRRESWKGPTYEVHHELFMDDGKLYALAHRFATATLSTGKTKRYFRDVVIELDPETGKTLGEVLDVHALVEDRMPERQYQRYNSHFARWKRGADPLHTNATTLIERDSPPFRKGDLLISFFNLHEIIGVRGWRTDTPKVIWRYAPEDRLITPHGPRLMDNGHVLYFENGEAMERFKSSVREIDPLTNTIAWEWDKKGELHAPFCGYVQDLPGERFLVSDTTSARMTEIDRLGRPLWEFLFAFEGKGKKQRARSCRGYKVVDPARWGTPMVALAKQVQP